MIQVTKSNSPKVFLKLLPILPRKIVTFFIDIETLGVDMFSRNSRFASTSKQEVSASGLSR